jgi:uroporphyrinogen decarboxylase
VRKNMQDSLFLMACRREPVDYTPVWIMRQAGRYMPEYRALRDKYSFWEMCKTPELAVEVTLQPVDAVGVDAAILFSDILVPVEAMGVGIEFTEGRGPVVEHPVRTSADVDALKVIDPEDVGFVYEAIRLLRDELVDRGVPLIGFSGAPYTLASYAVEGGGSRNYTHIKKMMYNEPELYDRLMNMLADVVIVYLKAQIKAGAQAVQLFESWASSVTPYDYRKRVMPYSKKVLDALKGEGVPVIHFANGAGAFLDSVAQAGGDVIGVDWRIDIDDAWAAIGDKGIQGNMDPVILLSSPEEIEKRVADILKRVGGKPGHIFNLGHGILPETPVEHARYFVDTVHDLSRK